MFFSTIGTEQAKWTSGGKISPMVLKFGQQQKSLILIVSKTT
jgi:hypothetical protein